MTYLWFAENLGVLPDKFDLCWLMEEDDLPSKDSAKEYVFLNGCAVYILSKLAVSQSMGLISSGFKNPKGARLMLSKRFPALPDAEHPLDRLPYITPQTSPTPFPSSSRPCATPLPTS
jgi:hypothetical protein